MHFDSFDLLKTSSITQHNHLHFIAEGAETSACPSPPFVVCVGRISMEEILSVCSGIYLHCSSVLRVGEKQKRVVRIGQRISATTILQLKNKSKK